MADDQVQGSAPCPDVKDMPFTEAGGLVTFSCPCGWQSDALMRWKAENQAITHVVNGRYAHQMRRSAR
ncbi:MAG: hypothetical protein JWN67_4999 [Actinomycetia bacterium]|nr:hypothetical protein [Actinomycetes bacterium]